MTNQSDSAISKYIFMSISIAKYFKFLHLQQNRVGEAFFLVRLNYNISRARVEYVVNKVVVWKAKTIEKK